jgi:hypothetical protein
MKPNKMDVVEDGDDENDELHRKKRGTTRIN